MRTYTWILRDFFFYLFRQVITYNFRIYTDRTASKFIQYISFLSLYSVLSTEFRKVGFPHLIISSHRISFDLISAYFIANLITILLSPLSRILSQCLSRQNLRPYLI